MTPSPRDRFRQDATKSQRHRDLVSSPELIDSIHVAFNQFCWELPGSTTPDKSWAASPLREGAQRFIETFLTLADQPLSRKQTSDAGQLNNPDASHDTRYGRKSGPASA